MKAERGSSCRLLLLLQFLSYTAMQSERWLLRVTAYFGVVQTRNARVKRLLLRLLPSASASAAAAAAMVVAATTAAAAAAAALQLLPLLLPHEWADLHQVHLRHQGSKGKQSAACAALSDAHHRQYWTICVAAAHVHNK
jgi:hypothetical protein